MSIDLCGDAGRLWVVVCAEHRREAAANMTIREAGYDTMWLHYPSVWKHARRSIPVLKSYFPGYLFAAVDEGRDHKQAVAKHIGKLNSLDYVAGVLWSEPQPLYIAPADIARYRRESLNAEGLHEPPPDDLAAVGRKPVLKPGDPVRIVGGSIWATSAAAKDLRAEVEIDRGRDLDVLVHGLFGGKTITLTLDPSEVEMAA